MLRVLPTGFHRIRHFGFLANACWTAKLIQIRVDLGAPEPSPMAQPADYRERYAILTGRRLAVCPCCGRHMVDVGSWPLRRLSMHHRDVTAHEVTRCSPPCRSRDPRACPVPRLIARHASKPDIPAAFLLSGDRPTTHLPIERP